MSRAVLVRPVLVRAVLAAAVLAASLTFALTRPAKLGLDLRGGSQIVLEAKDAPNARADAAAADRAAEVLGRRVDALGVAEASLTRSGARRIIVELPDVRDPSGAAAVLGRTAQLTVHHVRADVGAEPGKDERRLPDEDGTPLLLGPAVLTGDGVGSAGAGFDPESGAAWHVAVKFRGAGKAAWEKATARAACAAGDERRLAIVLDDRVISSPAVVPDVPCGTGITGGSTQITGDFSPERAKELAALVQGGSLPVPVEIVEQRIVGPTLGAAAIDASARAALAGIALTGLFIIAVYRLAGLLATVALAAYALISYGALVAVGATLTLPGLAGFVLAVGMAVDANVLAFERAREEYAGRPRRGPGRALATGFDRAWSAVADSAATTVLAAALLFVLASGPVRGFGVTLVLGVVCSLVSAMVVGRLLADLIVPRRFAARRPALTGIAGSGRLRARLDRMRPDVARWGRASIALCVLAAVLAGTGIAVRGLNLGVEFTGGRLVEYTTARPVPVDDARAAVAAAGFPRAVVQTSGGDGVSVRTGKLDDAQERRVRDALAERGGETTKRRDELIGPSLGKELRAKALLALGLALLAQLAYLAVRFRWTFATGTVVALLTDALLVVGAFAWLGRPVDGVFLAALLTVVGYSVNDSVVLFDRLRDLWTAKPREPVGRVAGRAILRTVPRTVNTGMGAVFVLAALALFGGDSLTDFAVALLIGIAAGTASSVLLAVPVAVELERFAGPPPDRSRPRPARRDPRDSGAVV
ncbi:protein translocase subunit SecD [Actinomadura atramentaria]|uniref:protein translocase subunit SecD n=1 Tax=Actinomadura atramentaria TaxID=1990 RepID=UPI0003AAA495|nr:protein translocase subunit SecD [Actinomadura atramentaria]